MTLALEKSLLLCDLILFWSFIWYSLCNNHFYKWTLLFLSSYRSSHLARVFFFLTLGCLCLFQVGYESPHPHMRVPGLPASLQSAASGKPWVSSFLPSIIQSVTCSLLTVFFQTSIPTAEEKRQMKDMERRWAGKYFNKKLEPPEKSKVKIYSTVVISLFKWNILCSYITKVEVSVRPQRTWKMFFKQLLAICLPCLAPLNCLEYFSYFCRWLANVDEVTSVIFAEDLQ